MPSRIIPFEQLQQLGAMYWRPPHGRDNGLAADTWVLLADIEKDQVDGILDKLADADVAGYIARSSTHRATADGIHRIYVDRTRYNAAVDGVMPFLRGSQPPTPGRTHQ